MTPNGSSGANSGGGPLSAVVNVVGRRYRSLSSLPRRYVFESPMKIRMTVHLSVLVSMTSLYPSWGADVGTTGAWIVERKSEGAPMRTGQVFPGSPAEKAGIKPNWFLISIDGTNVVKPHRRRSLG